MDWFSEEEESMEKTVLLSLFSWNFTKEMMLRADEAVKIEFLVREISKKIKKV